MNNPYTRLALFAAIIVTGYRITQDSYAAGVLVAVFAHLVVGVMRSVSIRIVNIEDN